MTEKLKSVITREQAKAMVLGLPVPTGTPFTNLVQTSFNKVYQHIVAMKDDLPDLLTLQTTTKSSGDHSKTYTKVKNALPAIDIDLGDGTKLRVTLTAELMKAVKDEPSEGKITLSKRMDKVESDVSEIRGTLNTMGNSMDSILKLMQEKLR